MNLQKLLYQPYKYLFYFPFFAFNTAILASLCVIVSLFNQRLGGRYVARPWSKLNYLLTPALVEIDGIKHFQKDQSYVVVANHMSMFDIFLLYGWLDLDLKWVMKKELRKAPFIGSACAAMGHIFIDRKNRQAARSALEALKTRFTHGTSILFFPEGTRSNDGQVKCFKRGAFMTAKELDLPILPITIIGSNKILPNGTLDLMPGKAKILIHHPIPVEVVREYDEQELLERAHAAVVSGIENKQANEPSSLSTFHPVN